MILQQQTGQYGFGLRSFQEFFAAVHLVQTSNDTKQYFNRLKAIMRFEHWANIALFMSGRIARTMTGQAVHLQSAWRAVDRDKTSPSNRYLRPGAWFALQVAADGSLGDTDLQASAIEDSLRVLETGLSSKQQRLFKSLVAQLPQRDQQEVLEPVLKDKISSLPKSCLPYALSMYGYCFGATPFFLKKVDVLLGSQHENLMSSAVGLIFERKPDNLQWTVERLKKYWIYCKRKVAMLWFSSKEDQRYFQKLLNASLLPMDLISELAEELLNFMPYYPSSSDRKPKLLISEPNSASDQLLLALRCIDWISYYERNFPRDEIRLSKLGIISLFKEEQVNHLPDISDDSKEIIKQVLSRTDLTPLLRLCLWKVFWYLKNPNFEMVATFLQEIWTILQRKERLHPFFSHGKFSSVQPLLSLAINKHFDEGQDSTQNLTIFFESKYQSSVAYQIKKEIQSYIKQANLLQKSQLVTSLNLGLGLEKLFPNLKAIADSLGVTTKELLNTYIYFYKHDSGMTEEEQNELEKILITTEVLIKERNLKDIEDLLRFISSSISWSPKQEIKNKAALILELLLDAYQHFSEKSYSDSILRLTLKLLISDEISQRLLKQVLNTVSKEEIAKVRPWYIREVSQKAFAHCLQVLKSLILSEAEDIEDKIALLLSRIIEAPERYGHNSRKLILELQNLHLNSVIGLHFLESEEIETRVSGIVLLTWSDHDIGDINHKNRLLNELQKLTIAREERAWSEFLQKFSMNEEESLISSFLEDILSEPKSYGSLILNSAMERYQRLCSSSKITISEEQERLLNLP